MEVWRIFFWKKIFHSSTKKIEKCLNKKGVKNCQLKIFFMMEEKLFSTKNQSKNVFKVVLDSSIFLISQRKSQKQFELADSKIFKPFAEIFLLRFFNAQSGFFEILVITHFFFIKVPVYASFISDEITWTEPQNHELRFCFSSSHMFSWTWEMSREWKILLNDVPRDSYIVEFYVSEVAADNSFYLVFVFISDSSDDLSHTTKTHNFSQVFSDLLMKKTRQNKTKKCQESLHSSLISSKLIDLIQSSST